MELEKFITSSTAFQKLRDNIRGFLGLEPSPKEDALDLGPTISFLDLPFAEDDQVDMPDEPVFSEQLTSPYLLPSLHQKIRDFFLPESAIPDGLSRVRWKCVSLTRDMDERDINGR